jgi:hypothetical protein
MNKNYTLFKISRAKNGYILEKKDVIDGIATEIEALTGIDGEEEVEMFAKFLWDIDENYGPASGRYDPKRIRTRIEPGDKTEGDSEEIDWIHESLINNKLDTESWGEYGQRIYDETKKRLEESKDFKARNGYK